MPADICMRPWEFAVAPFGIAGNLYYVGNANVSAHLINTGDGLILLDTAFPQTVYLLLESIRKLGFDPADIKMIVHSHAHYDHAGGTRAMVELTGAQTYLGEDDIFILNERPELFWSPEYGLEFHEQFKVDVGLKDGDTISLGSTVIEAVHIPGHTPGAMSYFFNLDEMGQSLRVGLHGGPGINTLQEAYMQKNDLPMKWREDYWASMQKLKKEKVDIFIGAHPGQNNTFERHNKHTEADNPFIDPDAWPVFLDGLEKNYINSLGNP